MTETKAAYRFFKNPLVTPRKLIEPLLAAGLTQGARVCQEFLLVVHDWSQLMFPDHSEKLDRISLSSKGGPEGYELQLALLVSDRDGIPLAPAVMSLRAKSGVHCTRSDGVRRARSPLDELHPAMSYVDERAAGMLTVHIVDAEADSVGHYRHWSKKGRTFLVRADDRIVEHAGSERKCSVIRQELHAAGKFVCVREVKYHGRPAQQWVAEVPVRLTRPAQRNRPAKGDRRRIRGAPLDLRLVIAEVRDEAGKLLAHWYLLSNVPPRVPTETIALWYYWRWSTESFFKLLKGAGMQVEEWQQTSASAILKRLLVASMACVTVWQLAQSEHSRADEARAFLVRLSGRQMKHRCRFTIPALLAGLWVLLAMLEALETYTMSELQEFAHIALPHHPRPNPP
jgi:hypothetical protein